MLEFKLEAVPDHELGTANLSVHVADHAVWPVFGDTGASLEVCLDDVLSYLVEYWKPLLLRQTYPIPTLPEKPSDLVFEAKRRWARLSASVEERESILLDAFEQAHNLGRAFPGLFELPALWLLRQGPVMLVDAGERLFRVPFELAEASLTKLGDAAADLLARAGGSHDRLIKSWDCRTSADEVALLAWSTGISKESAADLVADGLLEAPRNFADAANDNDELRIAARMAGGLPLSELREVLDWARAFPHRPSPALKNLDERVNERLASGPEREQPHRRGERAAIIVREELGIASDEFLDIFSVVSALGIELRTGAVDAPYFDGLSIWGPRHGPGIFLNHASARVRWPGNLERSFPARVTLAHELCHLLLDEGHAVSAVDVLGGRMPVWVEQVAKSFAGELLLPSSTAGRLWQEAGGPRALDQVDGMLRTFGRRFGVTRSVAAWKLEHGTAALDVDLHHLLNRLVPVR